MKPYIKVPLIITNQYLDTLLKAYIISFYGKFIYYSKEICNIKQNSIKLLAELNENYEHYKFYLY